MPSPVTPKHRSFSGDPERFDLRSAAEFQLLTALGLREFHYVLDIGCGALGTGRLLIPYLLAGRYYGIEREQWLVEEGIRLELGHDQVTLKQPRFLIQPDYSSVPFGVKFDYAMARSMSSLSAPLLKTCFEESVKCLRRNGVLVASSKNPESLCNVAADAGLDSKAIDWPHLGEETWVLLYTSEGIVPEDPSHGFQGCSLMNISGLEVIHDAPCGFVESIVDEGHSIVMTGWAIHPETCRPASYVLATNRAGRVAAKARVGISRTDVSSLYGKQALQAGFLLRIEKTVVEDPKLISCLGLTVGEKRAFALQTFTAG